MAKHLLGIDLGTSSVRAAIVRDDGSIPGVAGQGYPILTPSPGYAEQDPELWWNATCTTIRQALSQAGITGKDIDGISFSGQMHGGVYLDHEDKPVCPAIIWADSRSNEILNDLSGLLASEKFDKILCNRLFTGTQAATLYWFKRRDPATWRKIRRILLPKDWLRFKMCGLFNTEPSDASATFLFDVGMREWSKEVLSALDIPIEFLPFVTTSHQHIADTEGIEEETELALPFILRHADGAENGLLEVPTMDTYAPRAQFDAVAHQVVELSVAGTGITLDLVQALVVGHGEHVVTGDPAAVIVLFEQGKAAHPGK